jgi:hypothetical protein
MKFFIIFLILLLSYYSNSSTINCEIELIDEPHLIEKRIKKNCFKKNVCM